MSFSYEEIEKSIDVLRLDLSIKEFAQLAEEESFTAAQLEAVGCVLDYLQKKKKQTTIKKK